MHFSSRFYRTAAICSVVSALTTLGLIFLPRLYQPVPDFEARMALGTHPAYLLRSWIYLFHPFLVFTAALGIAARCRHAAAGAASLGLAGFSLWAATEAGQQALTRVALDRTWRAAWPTADEVARAAIRERVALYDVIWDAMYLLLVLGFFAGNVLLALAVRRRRVVEGRGGALDSWVVGVLLAAAALTLLLIVPELGGPTIPGTGWMYPLIQPAGRTLIGIWLWRESESESGLPA